MDKKVVKSFRVDANIVKALEQLSIKTDYRQTDLLEFAICNLYSMYFCTTGKVLDYQDDDFLMKLEVLRLQFSKGQMHP